MDNFYTILFQNLVDIPVASCYNVHMKFGCIQIRTLVIRMQKERLRMAYAQKNIGTKFNADGTVRRFPGNTIISMVNHEKDVFTHFLHVRELFMASPAAPCVTLLPLDSIHMTVIEGVCDQVRRPGYWTSFLPLDCPLCATDALFEERFAELAPLGKVTLRMSHVVCTGAILLRMEPVTPADEAHLRAYRDAASAALGLRFPNHDSYHFHITLGYFTKEPTPAQEQALAEFCAQADRYIAEHDIRMQAEEPLLTFFDSMFRFEPHRIPRDGE